MFPSLGCQKSGYLKLNRKWKTGDEIQMTFPMKERWIVREHHADYEIRRLKDGEIMYNEKPAKETPIAFLRGPIVYCVVMVWNPQISNDDCDLARDMRIDMSGNPKRIGKVDPSMMADCYLTKATYNGISVDLILTPFANIGQWWRNDKPNLGSNAFTYAIWNYPIK